MQALDLSDAKGNLRAILSLDRDGAPSLELSNAEGMSRVTLSLQPCAKRGRKAPSIQLLGCEELTSRSFSRPPLSIFFDAEA